MQITQFKINNLRTEINLTISDAATVNTLLLFTNNTYKDYNQAIDLSSKLTGSTTENITITLADLNLPFFDGLYFVEVEDSDEISQAITSDLTRYKECIIEKISQLEICDDCSNKKAIATLNTHQVLISLEDAISQGFIEESFNFIKMLDKDCLNDCNSCGKYSNVVNNNYYSTPQESSGIEPNIQKFELEAGDTIADGEIISIYQNGSIVYTKTYSASDPSEIIEIDISKPFKIVLESIPPNAYDIFLYRQGEGFEPPINLNNPYEILVTEAILADVELSLSGFPLIFITFPS